MKNAYRACAEIKLDALEHNVREIRSVIGEQTKLMGVIKTNAYGHGSVVLARELAEMGVDSFAVATLEEGIELRKHDITQPILVLGFVAKEQYPDMIRHHIMPSVFTYSMAKDIDAVAESMNTVADIHIKIDTGMSRIGFKANAAGVQNIIMINSLRKNIRIQGIFTHFACADCENDTMTGEQVKRFQYVIDQLEASNVHIPLKHCGNSATIMRYPELGMNMVRAGIILYGLYPSEEIEKTISLKPVMKLKSHIIFIKKVDAGTTVGYGATYVCQRPTTIATVSIGYGDGYPRALSNKGRVLIGSQAYPIIGRICMDQLMVDITDAEDEIKQGDEVILVGCQGSECISVEEVASAGDSFNYEFICNINRRIPRVYTRDGKIVEIVNYLIS
jgi:alanine racemase